jgi:hypothetical protein
MCHLLCPALPALCSCACESDSPSRPTWLCDAQEIQQYQQIAYNFEYVDHIASFLRELPQNNDRDMFDLSKAFEPKGACTSALPLLRSSLAATSSLFLTPLTSSLAFRFHNLQAQPNPTSHEHACSMNGRDNLPSLTLSNTEGEQDKMNFDDRLALFVVWWARIVDRSVGRRCGLNTWPWLPGLVRWARRVNGDAQRGERCGPQRTWR